MLSRTVTLETSDDISESEYAQKLARSMKALMMGLSPEIKALAWASVFVDLEPEAVDRVKELFAEASSKGTPSLWAAAMTGGDTELAALRNAHPDLVIERNHAMPTVLVVAVKAHLG